MWFRSRGSKRPPDVNIVIPGGHGDAQRAEATRAALERGNLPPSVVDRIERQRGQTLPWTSDLSVNEWALVSRLGFRPLGQVMGSCFYHVGFSVATQAAWNQGGWNQGGWAQAGWTNSYDLGSVERALYEGRTLALQRMAQEASLLGAHAVVGVRLHVHRPGLYEHESEFVALGTAVVLDNLPVPAQPVLCTVDGQSFAKLMMQGSVPVGLAMGIAVHHLVTSPMDRWQNFSWYNQEMTTYSEAVQHTRHRAGRSMAAEARSLQAHGVLAHETHFEVHDIEIEQNDQKRTDYILEFVSMGTAVASPSQPTPLDVSMVLDLGSPAART